MGFQDNSGDIIFDVILTDEGRRQLAEGTFNITKFKLSDDEVNYNLFVNTTGSAYQDIQILQTPIFEAFSNNTSNMSSLLVSYPNNNLLYLPVLKMNEKIGNKSTAMHTDGTFMVSVDEDTEGGPDGTDTTGVALNNAGQKVQGFLFGFNVASDKSSYIRIDAGIDNEAMPPSMGRLTGILAEREYLIEIDNRLGRICNRNGIDQSPVTASPDDDNIQIYSFSVNPSITDEQEAMVMTNTETQKADASQVIKGRRSTFLQFKIRAQESLAQSDYLFNRLGGTGTLLNNNSSSPGQQAVKFIDTLIKVTGVRTGYSVDVPVRFVKIT